jgi:tRNA(Met) cytidine acetyltransferase
VRPALRPRRATLLDGARAELHAALRAADLPPDETVWLGGIGDDGLHANRILGRDLAAVVVDPCPSVDANRLGAALGALRGGGELLWLRDRDRAAPVPSVLRCERLLEARAALHDGPIALRTPATWQPSKVCPPAGDPTEPLTDAQRHLAGAIAAHLVRARGDGLPGTLLLGADRGRGKSAALGLACADALLRLGAEETIVVTSAQRAGVTTLLRHGRARCERLGLDPERLVFTKIEELGDRPLPRLVVDEAGTLPLALLDRLADRVPALVLATTEHGYEGSGQALRLRLLPSLAARLGERLEIRSATTPLRWPDGDPLEVLAAEFLLYASAAGAPETSAVPHCAVLTREDLARDETLLAAAHGLLREGHYQTRPADLFRMLDDEAVRVWSCGEPHAPLACALTIDEGGLAADLAAAMVRGERRPRGQLGPGVLAERLGLRAGAELRSVRVNRIVVHGGHRRRGLGAALLAAIGADTARRGAALVTSSFALEAGLLEFWRGAGLRALRFGDRANPVSGARSVFVAGATSAAGEALLAQLPEVRQEPS